jgi:signal peptidase I
MLFKLPRAGSESNSRRALSPFLSTVFVLLAAPVVALALTAFVFQSYEVDGQSMETTLQNQDRLIVNKVPRTFARLTGHNYIPNRGDIIIFHESGANLGIGSGQDMQLIKRVIGLPGDQVAIHSGAITIYNTQHPDGYNPDKAGSWGDATPYTGGDIDTRVGSGQVFVCGDNRNNSRDSRSFGPIDTTQIAGKLALRVYPLSKAHVY